MTSALIALCVDTFVLVLIRPPPLLVVRPPVSQTDSMLGAGPPVPSSELQAGIIDG